MSAPVRSFAVLALAWLAGCSEPSSASDAGPDAPAARDAGPDAVPEGDAGDACEREITPRACRPRFEGPTAAVEVVRDADGVPHLYGQRAGDVFFASGYMQAHDRLVQMELMRRRALGTRAEVLGEGAVDDDTIARLLEFGRWGAVNASTLAREEPEQYVLLEAWAAGVNRYLAEIRSGAEPRPPGFGADELDFVPEDWSVDHALAIAKLLLFGNASQLEYDILASILSQYFEELYAEVPIFLPLRDAHTVPPEERPTAFTSRPLPEVPRDLDRAREAPRALPADAEERFRRFFARFSGVPGLGGSRGASNNWAIEGRHTVDGRPMIAGDPHQGFSSPNIFWLHHLHSARPEDGLDVIGWSFLGSPAIQLGHNRHIAWTATTTYPDVMDLWAVRGDADSVSIGGEDVSTVSRTETIPVRGAEPVEIEVVSVPAHGVILPSDLAPLPITRAGQRILFRWIGFAPTHEALGFARFDRATDLEEFEAAADIMEIATFNFVAAHAEGITYRSSPSVPVRRGAITARRQPWRILDGDDADALWSTEILGPGQLPRSRGGSRGWVATANNEPFGFNDDGDYTNGPYYFGMFFDPGTRAHRIEEELVRLTSRGAVTLEDMQTLQDDTRSVLADDLVPALLAAWDGRATDPALEAYRDRADLGALVERLRDWDRRMERASSEAVVFNAFLYLFTRDLLADDFSALFEPILESEPMYLLKVSSLCVRDVVSCEGFWDGERTRLLVAALEGAAQWLTARFGGTDADRYRWSDVHGTSFRSVLGDAFRTPWVPTDGGDGTVNVAKARLLEGGELVDRVDVGGGAVYRMVARFREDGTPEAYFQMPRGVSGRPGDPFYENLHADWVEHRYRRLRFERSEVEDRAAERFVIEP
jgi:penicillin amidase